MDPVLLWDIQSLKVPPKVQVTKISNVPSPSTANRSNSCRSRKNEGNVQDVRDLEI